MEDLRKDYKLDSFSEKNATKDPFKQFSLWFDDVNKAGVVEANAFSLSTVNTKGKPSSRMVLLKDIHADGYIFYSGYLSRKGKELEANSNAAMLFYWPDLERQVRIEGKVEKVSAKISDKYFASRPIGAQISAAISVQSSVVKSREILEKSWKELMKKSEKEGIKRPERWGGYKLLPDYFEFWQGRDNRLHDRLNYIKNGKGPWKIQRLSP